jgi:hypothetical protein
LRLIETTKRPDHAVHEALGVLSLGGGVRAISQDDVLLLRISFGEKETVEESEDVGHKTDVVNLHHGFLSELLDILHESAVDEVLIKKCGEDISIFDTAILPLLDESFDQARITEILGIDIDDTTPGHGCWGRVIEILDLEDKLQVLRHG